MRFIMLDTETTGLRVEEGHRLIEIGCIECVDRRVTERQFHAYINPEREIDEGATQVHGMTWDQLKDKPRFSDVADEFLRFVDGAQIVIHNAEFDRGFLDEELKRIGRPPFAEHVDRIIDSLSHARDLHPGQRNSLDALCQRYSISNEHRVLHGALLDARLLADVYMAMTRGQESLVMLDNDHLAEGESAAPIDVTGLVVRRANAAERAAHESILSDIDKASGGKTIWTRSL
jgi:DNA polymerase III subunit epsilon